MGKKYDFTKIEKKWQAAWKREKVYEPNLAKPKKPFYNLMMFPYPSAEGLHVGNMYAFTGSDIYGRMKRMQGHDVFEPIGLDGFGIHSENYALKIGAHPAAQAKVSEKRFYKQLESIGNGFSWEEHLETYDSAYYKWTQWIFTQMWKHGLAYRKKQAVNWCPSCKTVLADEQVVNEKCERCSSVVEKRELEQWFFGITKYADRLLKNIEGLDWSERVKIAQRNWIGKAEGALIRFPLHNVPGQRDGAHSVEVFTTRPDTLFGVTFLVVSPESAQSWLSVGWKVDVKVRAYVKKALVERAKDNAEDKSKTGVFSGIYALNPANQEKIPVWVSDYVLAGYGTGAIMAVPAHDERDFEFAKKYELPVRYVVEPMAGTKQKNPSHKDKVSVLVENAKGEILTINWGPQLGGRLLIGGTMKPGEDPIEAAKREVAEETGYKNLALVAVSDERMHYEYFAHSKQKEFIAHARLLHFRLKSDARAPQSLEEDEKGKFAVEWITKDKARKELVDPLHRYTFDKFIEGACYGGAGILINSGTFTGMDSEEAKWKIAKEFGVAQPPTLRPNTAIRSILMGFKDISKRDLDALGIREVRAAKKTQRFIEIPEKSLSMFEKLIAKKMTPGFWNEYVGQGKVVFLFKDKKGVIERMELTLETDQRINHLSAAYNNQPEPRGSTWDWLSNVPFYAELFIPSDNKKSQYRLRDWLISRQRYWGPPIPMIFCDSCAKKGAGERAEMPGWYAVSEKDLSVKLPLVKDFRPRGTGASPLASVKSFYEVKCPVCKGKARRETDVSDTFLDSAWYYLRYADAKNEKKIFDQARVRKWLPVDMYIGGAEHSVLHLLYARFMAMAMHDWGFVDFEEPFKKFRAHGLVIKDGAKMSKSKGNVINPDEYVKKFGADVLRTYLMFLAPFEQGGDFRDAGIIGAERFLMRVWHMGQGVLLKKKGDLQLERVLHRAIHKVTEDINELHYNTAVSAMMIALNEIEPRKEELSREQFSILLRLLAPFAPHMTEELWRTVLGNKASIHRAPWPEYNPALVKDSTVTIIVQVNGKVRDSFSASANISQQDVEIQALELPRIKELLASTKPKRMIYIPGRLVNIVV